ncbi:MAG: redoxin domain-containing protein [Chloroflexi bacterium]|nr:redoxin domain-containing protein [Chloroflexota bacterium]
MPLEVGRPAPDFEAKAALGAAKVGDNVRLSDILKEKHVVLAFFPLAFTGG